MNYTFSPDEYYKQLKRYYELEKISFSKDDTKDYVLQKLEERSLEKRNISNITNTIIAEYIERYEKAPEILDEENVKVLEDFYDSLIDKKTNKELDLGIMLRMNKILKDYYKKNGLEKDYIRLLERCVTVDRILVFNHVDNSHPSPYIKECMDLVERISELDDEQKRVLLSMLYWVYIDHEDDLNADNHPIYALLNIDKFINDYIKDNSFDVGKGFDFMGTSRNSLNVILEHFLWMNRHNKKVDVEAFRPQMERFALNLRNALDSNSSWSPATKISFESTLLHTNYHLGKISIEELLDKLSILQATQYDNETPVLTATRLAKINYHYLVFLYRYSGYPKEKIVELSQKRIKEVFPKLFKITREINNASFNLYLLFFIIGASYTSRFEEFASYILEMTVYSDKALFVHTEMVRELSMVIFDYLIENNPKSLDGVAGKDVSYIINHKEEMKNLLSECCMFHDVGKFFMLDIVENSMRKLTDEEYEIIKAHPNGFEEFSRNWLVQDERLHCIHDCALTHHLWHNGSGGYPNIKHTKNRPFVDILAIADSIDAATDNYGRPYRINKDLDTLIEEFKNESNTRYGVDAVNSLTDKNVRDKIQKIISERRKEVYYQIYCFNKVLD